MTTQDATDPPDQAVELTKLWECFKDEPVFLEAIEAFDTLLEEADNHDKVKAYHKIMQCIIDDGCLWHLFPHYTKCITQPKAEELAAMIYREGGHFSQEAVWIMMLD
ncbi:hypothetical protein QCA50_001346 [Cerrena zonata]|uniref:Uncharacterized protein n=1 Tax=Cerrena zonata TaxID=2478898 RepID=A0AAW0GN44_9APHY